MSIKLKKKKNIYLNIGDEDDREELEVLYAMRILIKLNEILYRKVVKRKMP